MSDKGALGSVQQSLRKCFDTVEQHHEEWKLTLLECDPLVANLSNLAEQMEACQKVIFKNSPLSAFADLQGRLHYKLKSAMEVTLEKLNDYMCILQRVRDSVSHQVGAVLYVYEVNAGKIGLEASLVRSAVSPSIADMLEWLQDIEKHYRNQYLQRRLLLQVRYDHLSEIRNLPQSWSKVEEKSASKQKLVEGLSGGSAERDGACKSRR
ncbi:ribosome biogenesis protein C1orf109 homolog isoform X2 [Spea bombifrons]|uniref:ribosome biogenesis protein C1orf109 homolog isoform X2 n=1 Tax=Spea bombifrons TaxID=233779 RepID=UPI00234A56F6|nr:ribosome biogenesis protein C1orf109 homolog isoform X2 [Spea bombifrons]